MSDPNGLVYYKGVYHLYFQHNSRSNVRGTMSWGHASSRDLVHWTEHPVAIRETEGEEVYSGSVVVDSLNSSGFGTQDAPPLVAIYTSAYHDGTQAQSLAFSTDAGLTWTKYAGNPVLDRASTSFRDPNVSWYATPDGAGYWVMVAVEAEARQVLFFRSEDLKGWTYMSTVGPFGGNGRLWECPHLFPIAVDGDPTRTMWILVVSVDAGRTSDGTSTWYSVGHFDGTAYRPAQPDGFYRLDWGRDLYAAIGFDNVPDGRRILIGWMNNWNYAAKIPTDPWRGTMSLPRELTLATVDGDVQLRQRPPAEFSALDMPARRVSLPPVDLVGRRSIPIDGTRQYRIEIVFEPLDAEEVGLDLFVGDGQLTRLSYDLQAGLLKLDRTRSGDTKFEASFASIDAAPVRLRDGALELCVFVDRASVEVFAQGGAVCLTDQVFPESTSAGLAIFSVGGATRVATFEWTPLQGTSNGRVTP